MVLLTQKWEKTYIDQTIYFKIVLKFRDENSNNQLSVVSKKALFDWNRMWWNAIFWI